MRVPIIEYRFHPSTQLYGMSVLAGPLRDELESARLQRTELQAETLTRDDTSSTVHLATLALNGKREPSQVTWYRADRFIRSYDLVVMYCAEPTSEEV